MLKFSSIRHMKRETQQNFVKQRIMGRFMKLSLFHFHQNRRKDLRTASRHMLDNLYSRTRKIKKVFSVSDLCSRVHHKVFGMVHKRSTLSPQNLPRHFSKELIFMKLLQELTHMGTLFLLGSSICTNKYIIMQLNHQTFEKMYTGS